MLSARRALAGAVLAPLLLTGLVACGGGDSDSSSADPSAADTSASSTPGSPAATDLSPGDSVDPADFSDLLADGFANVTTAHTTIKGALGAGGSMTGEGDVDYTGDSPAAAMTMSTPAFGADHVEIRLVGRAMYLNLGQLSHGKFWKLDLDDPNSPFGALGSQLDPKSSVELLEKGMKSVEYVGGDGSLAQYRVSVDPKAMLEGMGPMAGSGTPSMPKSLEYDLWLDDQSRVNRLTVDMGSLGSVEMTMSDFGKDVSIEAPSPDDVTEMPGVFSSPSADGQA